MRGEVKGLAERESTASLALQHAATRLLLDTREGDVSGRVELKSLSLRCHQFLRPPTHNHRSPLTHANQFVRGLHILRIYHTVRA